MEKEIKKIDKQLLRDTTFIVIGKEELKKKINEIVDKEFKFLEKHLKGANEALNRVKKEL